MFQVGIFVVTIFVIFYALVGMATGALVGALVRFCLRLRVNGIEKDAILGAVGFFVGFVTCIVLSPQNTITSNTSPNPNVFAFLGAGFLPILWELYRFKISRSHRPTT
jgi:hypothetical protein